MLNRKPVLWVYLTHFQSDTKSSEYKIRFGYLATSIFYLSQILEYQVKIMVITNFDIPNFHNLAEPIHSRLDESTIEQYICSESEITADGKKYDWLLTWVHKSPMQQNVEATPRGSKDLFLVLEDDALFTGENLSYFLNELCDLEEIGLIPTFIRSEWSNEDACWTHEDPLGRITETASYFPHPKDDQKALMQLRNPFSASILLNQTLATEYFASESSVQALACYKHPIIYDIGSSASLGLIMEKIPKGYLNRVAVICNRANGYPIPGSVVRHLGDRYAQDKWHRNIRLYDQTEMQELPTNRTPFDYLRRLFRRDAIYVMKKFLLSKNS
jgi:hypothetical protein